MTTVHLPLPGAIAVVAGSKVVHQLARLRQLFGADTAIETVVADLSRLAVAGALPVRLDNRKGDWSIEAFTRRHLVRLYPTKRGDAYMLGWVDRITFRDQARLVRGALVLSCPAGWHLFPDLAEVSRQTRPLDSQWALIARVWASLGQYRPAPAVPPHHEAFLDVLTEVVEAGRDIETARQRETAPTPYRRLDSTRERRHSARGVYSFQLLRPTQLAAGSMVYVSDDQELRGRVLRVLNREAVVRFEPGVDYRQIPPNGSLRSLPSDRVFRAQLEAIDIVRQGKALDPGLLAALVDGTQRSYTPDSAMPRNPLDADQLKAFRAALKVPDRLLVLGPPGTGKTRTITEIADTMAARNQRVLITSHTNRAVDNVLEKLPSTVRVVRLGNEDSMTSRARSLMVETQVAALQQEILDATQAEYERVRSFADAASAAARLLDYLSVQLGVAFRTDADRRRLESVRSLTAERLTAPLKPQLDAAAAMAQAQQAEATRARHAAETAAQRLATTERKATGGLFAFIHRRNVDRRRSAWQRLDGVAMALAHGAAQAAAEYERQRAHAHSVVTSHPEIIRINADIARTVEAVTAARVEAGATADRIRACGVGRAITQPMAAAGFDEWQRYHDAIDRELASIKCRAELLTDWRDQVTKSDVNLQHELVRYADVVAATCIGTATSGLLNGVEFELAIVDEAGQISTPNLLVPLVRSRRSVLVGDHRQLPPFLDNEVEQWAASYPGSGDEVRDVLTRSAFERMYNRCDELHKVMLKKQRRMPENLARFVSANFYGNLLRTEHAGGPPDPIFRRPFAMIDTSDRPAEGRCEQPVKNPGGKPSYQNELEATLIAALIGHHVQHYKDWAVIVPFKPQVALVAELLNKNLGQDDVTDNVGTVDSFQGGERDLIVYGFTRSNSEGNVGFLKELRRLNVAITRARQQLVVVGDRDTLCRARDSGFARLARAMVEYLENNNSIHPSLHIEHQLAQWLPGAR